MAIARNPKRNLNLNREEHAQAFITAASDQSLPAGDDADENKRPVMIRINPAMLRRIDHAARRLGLSRSGFIVSSAARRLESMEREAVR
jgi:hypothetical protein